jgi:hypothetical protein
MALSPAARWLLYINSSADRNGEAQLISTTLSASHLELFLSRLPLLRLRSGLGTNEAFATTHHLTFFGVVRHKPPRTSIAAVEEPVFVFESTN